MKKSIKSILGNFLKLKYSKKLIRSNSLTIFCFHDVSDNPSKFNYTNNLDVPINFL